MTNETPTGGGRPIRDWRTVHLALPPDHLRTACGLAVPGHFRLVDGQEVECPACKAATS